MTNQSISDELDRYAAVNAMFLTMQGSESLDVSYQGYVDFMKNTDWDSPAAEGGKHTQDRVRYRGYYASNITSRQGTTWKL